MLNLQANQQEDYELLDEFISRDLLSTNFKNYKSLVKYISGHKTAVNPMPNRAHFVSDYNRNVMKNDRKITNDETIELKSQIIIPKNILFKQRSLKYKKFASLRRKKKKIVKKLEQKDALTVELFRERSYATKSYKDIKKVRHKKNVLKQKLKTRQDEITKKKKKKKLLAKFRPKRQGITNNFLNSFYKVFDFTKYTTLVNFSSNINWV